MIISKVDITTKWLKATIRTSRVVWLVQTITSLYFISYHDVNISRI